MGHSHTFLHEYKRACAVAAGRRFTLCAPPRPTTSSLTPSRTISSSWEIDADLDYDDDHEHGTVNRIGQWIQVKSTENYMGQGRSRKASDFCDECNAGSYMLISYFRTSRKTKWQRADSCGGFSGETWRDSGYDSDLKQSALDQLAKAQAEEAEGAWVKRYTATVDRDAAQYLWREVVKQRATLLSFDGWLAGVARGIYADLTDAQREETLAHLTAARDAAQAAVTP